MTHDAKRTYSGSEQKKLSERLWQWNTAALNQEPDRMARIPWRITERLAKEAEALEATQDRWRDAFRAYGRHADTCATRYEHPQGIVVPTPDCDCGYQDWLNAAVLPIELPDDATDPHSEYPWNQLGPDGR